MREILDTVSAGIAAAPFGILLILKSGAILGAGMLVALALRNRSASVRHAVLALTLAMSLALPLGMMLAPEVDVVVSPTPVVQTTYGAPVGSGDANTSSVEAIAPLPGERQSAASFRTEIEVPPSESFLTRIGSDPRIFLLLLWPFGALLVIGRMAAGHISLSRVARQSVSLGDAGWQSLLDRESRTLGVRHHVRVLKSGLVSTPLTFGIRKPVIILPDEATAWNEEHRQVVLRHELAHIGNGDAFICLLAGFVCAVYWFNPLAWMAARRLRTEQERACDDRVIALGTPAPDYASHLLEVARSARELGMQGLVSVAMARPSQLEGRLLAVLNDRDRSALTRSKRIASAVMASFLLLAISALRPVAAESAIVVASQSTSAKVAPVVVTAVAAAIQREAADSVVTGDVAASSGGTLVLDLETGASVTITGTNENRVRMRALLGGRDWRSTNVTIRNSESGVRVHTEYTRQSRSQSSSHRMEISVPRRFNVRISSAGGGVTIRDVEGDFSGSTGGGEIWIERARGNAKLTTGGGPVDVANSTLSGSVSTGGGSVLIQGVTGGLKGHSGTGDVLYGTGGVTFSEPSRDGVRRASDGRLFIRKSGGSVNLPEAPDGASISTGGGAIQVGASGGELTATTGGGDITIGPVAGSAEVSTGAGDVTITGSGGGSRFIKATSGNGTITVTLPRDFSGTLDLETAFTNNRRNPTRIESDWAVNATVTRDWDSTQGTPRRYVRARQSLGEGSARVTVRTINGNVIIRRAR